MAWADARHPDTPAEDVIIPPWEALLVLRREPAPLFFRLEGEKTDIPIAAPIALGVNLLANLGQRMTKETFPVSTERESVPASQIPVYTLSFDPNGDFEFLPSDSLPPWWETLGIAPGDPVYVNRQSAFVFFENSGDAPFFLQW